MKLGSSLSRRMAIAIVIPLALAAAVLGGGGAVITNRVVERTSDRLLAGSLQAIAATATVEDGQVWINLPPWALGVLDNPQRDSVFYSARQNGRLLTGYDDLPVIADGSEATPDPVFRSMTYKGQRVRMGALVRSYPGSEGAVVISVAQSYESRSATRSTLLGWLVALEIALVVLAGALVWPGVIWSLRPLRRLRRTLDQRARAGKADFTPAELTGVPRELTSVVKAFNAVLGQLGRATERERRFTADASHQIRTPLTVLHTSLAVMQQRRGLSQAARRDLDDARAAAGGLQRLLLQLLALARAETEGGAIPTERFDLAALCARACEEHQAQAAEVGSVLTCDAPTPVMATGNRDLTREIVGNLIDNALRYASPGAVRVMAGEHDGHAVLRVCDNGPGVPPEERERVLERFYRSARVRGSRGSGLGLPIVKALADRMGARVELDTAPAGGLEVRVSWTD